MWAPMSRKRIAQTPQLTNVRSVHAIQAGIGMIEPILFERGAKSGQETASIGGRCRFTVEAVTKAVKRFAIDVVANRSHGAVGEYGVYAGGMRGAEAVAEFFVGIRQFTVPQDWKDGRAEDIVVPAVCPTTVVEFWRVLRTCAWSGALAMVLTRTQALFSDEQCFARTIGDLAE